MKCACGRPLHYANPDSQRMVEGLIALVGDEYVLVTAHLDGKWRQWRVQRHYIALHGIKADELPAIAPALGFEEVPYQAPPHLR